MSSFHPVGSFPLINLDTFFDDVPEDSSEETLCVPGDSLEDLGWYPSYADCCMSTECYPPTPKLDCGQRGREGAATTTAPSLFSAVRVPTKARSRYRPLKRASWLLERPELSKSAGSRTDVAEGLKRRKCSHCSANETPQWRSGPRGAGTLCNACGIRFKLGRLWPESRRPEKSRRRIIRVAKDEMEWDPRKQ